MLSIKEVLSGVLQELQSPKKAKHRKLLEMWPAIAGAKFSKHTKPFLTKQKRLNVWVDQSALAFELRQRYQQTLLKRTQAVLGEEEVTEIRFFVGQLR